MYIDHYRKDFYELLLGHRVLLMASYDVDSVCTVKILQYLLRMDENPYILVSVDGVEDMKQKFNDYRSIRRVVLINCGGTIDLMDLFENPEETIFFVIDSHRPTHILNIYNESKQIRIVSCPVDDEDIPSFDEIFRAEEEEELNSDDDSSEDDVDDASDVDENGEVVTGEKRKRGAERRAEVARKIKQRRDWEAKRHDLLFNYTKNNYYGAPAALTALEVAWSKSIGDSDIVWWAIVGLTEYFVLRRMDRANYTLFVSQIQNHVARITHETADSLSVLKITFENDLHLFLYRQWNLYASMRHTPTWRCKFRLWTSKGTQRLHSYLVEIGLPLKEVKEEFQSMKSELRRNLKTILNKKAESYDLDDDMYFGTFIAQFGYAYKYSALDHYLAALSLLEEPGDKSLSTRFFNALQCLCKTNRTAIDTGIGIAKLKVAGMISQVQILLDLNQVIITNDFLYAVIQWGTLDAKYFAKVNSLILLAHHLLEAFISSNPRGKNMRQLPLVLLAPNTSDTHHCVGIPPLASSQNQNLFGKAFEQLAKKMPTIMSMDLFEPSTCIIKSSEIEKFFELLMDLMA